jgi:predicted nucleic acid-binding protein
MLVTIDTHILIWAVKQEASPGQDEMIPRAQAFLDWIERNSHRLALTAEVIGEFLCGGTEEQRLEQLQQFQGKIPILDYNTNAAAIAARIRSSPEFIQQLKTDGKTRACVLADIAIVATAKAHGVERIYSHDAGMRKAATRCNLSAMDLPTLEQLQQQAPSPRERRSPRTVQKGLFDAEESDEPEGGKNAYLRYLIWGNRFASANPLIRFQNFCSPNR